MVSSLFDQLFIFEMANNHQGSLDHGMLIIDEMGKIVQKHKINAALKFQYRHLDSFIHPEQRHNSDNSHISRFLSTRLSHEQFQTMVRAVKERQMQVMVTPFDEESVPLILKHNVDIIKVASASISDWPLLEEIVKAGKPIVASTGGATIQEIDAVVSFFTNRNANFAILHCVSIYPTRHEDLQLLMISRLRERYPQLKIGYSGHEEPTDFDVAKVAVSLGAEILERHVGFPTDTITLNKYSMNPEQTETWVYSALLARSIIGQGKEKKIPELERNSLLDLRRGVFAKQDIEQGQLIQREDVFFAMPCIKGQLTSGEFGQYRTEWYASKNYSTNEAIFESQKQENTITNIRRIIHDAKGMLAEAHISLGKQYEIELSHHYGLENFRQTGAIIVDLVNREYCKKIIVMHPKQCHPNHRHMVKEETFQILWGDLEIRLNDIVHNLRAGDMLLIERGTWHSFRTEGGVIFEEVSTTHIKGDSYYEDARINRKDLIERKTKLEEW
jgi:sialic acid synthase SpsE/quercetin dioxygenase-like cupin family protein